jgi:hypothetical protein
MAKTKKTATVETTMDGFRISAEFDRDLAIGMWEIESDDFYDSDLDSECDLRDAIAHAIGVSPLKSAELVDALERMAISELGL